MLGGVGHGKFAVLIVADRRQLRYRRILTKPKINNNTATAKVVAVVFMPKRWFDFQKTCHRHLF